MISLLDEYEYISTSAGVLEHLPEIIFLDEYVPNIDDEYPEWDELFNRVQDLVELCWGFKENDENLECSIMVKFKASLSSTVGYEIPIKQFMMSMCYFRPMLTDFARDPNQDLTPFIVTNDTGEKDWNRKINLIGKHLQVHGADVVTIKNNCAGVYNDMQGLLTRFAGGYMQPFTLDNLFMDHYLENAEIREINNTEYSPDTQTADIVKINATKFARLSEIMIERGNPYFVDNKFVKILDPKQMEELYINQGQTTDGNEVVPVIMNCNGFKGGFTTVQDVYVNAMSGRVPDMMNKEYMGSAGYFGRNLHMFTYGTISPNIWDCGSKNSIKYTITEKHLEMLDGRYYYVHGKSGIMRILRSTDTHLIGRTLYFRSPICCNLSEDCCHICYGNKALQVGSLKGGFVYTTTRISRDIGQKVLSVKHILKTNAEPILMSPSFDKYCALESSDVVINVDDDFDDDFKFNILFKENFLDNIFDELVFYVGNGKNYDKYEKIVISNYTNIEINELITSAPMIDAVIDGEEVSCYKISSTKIGSDKICTIIPINKMQTEKYFDIMSMLESKISKFETVDDACEALLQLIYKTMPILQVHMEIVVSRLVKSVDNVMIKPNWLNEDEPYQIVRLQEGLNNIESAATAMSFESLNKQLFSKLFDARTNVNRIGPHSFSDYLFGDRE